MKRRKFLSVLSLIFLPAIYFAQISPIFASPKEEMNKEHNSGSNNMSDDESNNNNYGNMDNNHNYDDHDDYDDDHDDDYDDDDHDQDKALKAVKSKRAIPYKKMLKIFRKDHSGKILDVSFGLKNNILLYRFKYINEEGHVRIIYYYASNGEQVKNADIIN